MKATKRQRCGCRTPANQYGMQLVPCEEHGRMMRKIAFALGITNEELLDRAVTEYLAKYKEDA